MDTFTTRELSNGKKYDCLWGYEGNNEFWVEVKVGDFSVCIETEIDYLDLSEDGSAKYTSCGITNYIYHNNVFDELNKEDMPQEVLEQVALYEKESLEKDVYECMMVYAEEHDKNEDFFLYGLTSERRRYERDLECRFDAMKESW